MLRIDECALMCDLAETYGIYEYKSLPARQVAIFSVGLRDSSRIKSKVNEEVVSRDLFMQAVIADRLGVLCHFFGGSGSELPPSFVDMFLGINEEEKKSNSNIETFESAEDFQKAWRGGK